MFHRVNDTIWIRVATGVGLTLNGIIILKFHALQLMFWIVQ